MAGRSPGRIARALVTADATVVSGLAFGIDGAAHEATIRAGGVTVAVIGGGHARVGPRAHDRLADAIRAGGGAVVSEYAPDVEPTAGTFPRRNRIISGLSSRIGHRRGAGPQRGAHHRLVGAGAGPWRLRRPRPARRPGIGRMSPLLREFGEEVRVVAGVPHLIADLGFSAVHRGRARSGLASGPMSRRRPSTVSVRSSGRSPPTLLAGERTVDAIVATTDLPVATVLATLTLLERRGAVLGRHGRYYPDGELLGPLLLPKAK